ncbi:MAG: class I SAM-dependent methyltransferase [Nanoarchaeota archaeon]|nr:class I SAM-dependent methyltransferase [Nanoarchaeota archaeon]
MKEKKGKEDIIKHFKQLVLKEDKKGTKIFGWGSRKSQYDRFDVIIDIGDFNNKSVLDVGCGTGDFYNYLLKRGFRNFHYKGIDISPEMIAVAKGKRYKGAKFVLKDVDEVEKGYDFVVASGAFNILIDNNWDFLIKRIKIMFKIAKIGISFNLLSDYADKEFIKRDKGKICYYNPVKILDFCMKLSRKVVLKHNYMPNDFTIYLYK